MDWKCWSGRSRWKQLGKPWSRSSASTTPYSGSSVGHGQRRHAQHASTGQHRTKSGIPWRPTWNLRSLERKLVRYVGTAPDAKHSTQQDAAAGPTAERYRKSVARWSRRTTEHSTDKAPTRMGRGIATGKPSEHFQHGRGKLLVGSPGQYEPTQRSGCDGPQR
uniref:(northern house mosquito) hypothetical protein n=2 Tax=Culex pipiens TaxID=7175 RepID=A0A8D8CLX1_CULPI